MRPEAGPGLQPVYRSSSPELASGPRGLAPLLPLAIGDAQAMASCMVFCAL